MPTQKISSAAHAAQALQASTVLIHHDYHPPAGFYAPQAAVHKASTVIFPSVNAMRTTEWMDKSGYTYGLHGTPTTFTLEERLCALEGAKHCVLVPSGLAAIGLANLALLQAGDHVMMPDNVYGPAKTLASGQLQAYGISHGYYDAMHPAALAEKMTPQTKVVWIEAAGSVSLEFPDVAALSQICRDKGVISVLDNTWGAGLAFDPFDVDHGAGVDVSVQALTKYPSGGGDVLMGSVMTRGAALHKKILLTHMRLGLGVGANDVEAVLRSLPSMALRYDAHDASARQLARWLQTQPQIAQVLHPALSDSPGHTAWQSLCGAKDRAAGLVSVVFHARYAQADVDRFCDALKLFKLGYSWGGPMSLAVPYDMLTMRSVMPWSYKGCLVRLAIGLEDAQDLQADLAQALCALPA